ncbi:MAG TPA: hypothetical protein VLI89_07605 [Burkholderiales bacterium]|nr:hypothetical protein [Burkholderiales bacterium]
MDPGARPVKDAGFFLVVRFWIAPGGEPQVMRWLEGGHMAEVLRQSGFLWVRRLRLAETDATGWSAHAMIYGIDSRASYEKYMANRELHERFAREREPFAAKLRIERFAGDVDLAP